MFEGHGFKGDGFEGHGTAPTASWTVRPMQNPSNAETTSLDGPFPVGTPRIAPSSPPRAASLPPHYSARFMQALWLARHGNRQDFVDPEWAATADRPHDPRLSPDGVQQARRLGTRVSSIEVDRILSSPFLRAVQTAHPAARALDARVVLEPGLGEWFNADWFETRPQTFSPSTLQKEFDRVASPPSDAPCREPSFPESRPDALRRLGATGQCLVSRYPDETLFLVGHGITVLGVLRGLVGSDVPDPGCPLASLTKIVRTGDGWEVALRNDTSHLDSGARAADRLS